MKSKLALLSVAVAMTCASASATSNGVQQQIDDLREGLHQVHMNTLQKYSESWGLEDRANIAKLQDQKVDKSVFAADQARQDAHINDVQNAAQSANEKADAGAVRMDGIEHQAGVLDGRVGATEVRADKLEEGQRQQDTQMTYDRQQRIDGDVALDKRIDGNSSDIVQLYSRADSADTYVRANRDAINDTNRVVSQHSAQLSNHEQRLATLEQETNRNFSSLRSEMQENKKDADAGIAGVAAMASIPQVTEYQTFAVGAGVGSRHDQQALAVGFSARAAQSVVVKLSAATDTNSGWTLGAGASIGW